MVDAIGLSFIRFWQGEGARSFSLFLFVLSLLVAAMLLGVHCRAMDFVWVGGLVFLGVSISIVSRFLRQRLIVHERVGEKRVINYFLGLRKKDRRLMFWRAGDVLLKKGDDVEIKAISVAEVDDRARSKSGKYLISVGTWDIDLDDKVSKFFPSGVSLRMALSGQYNSEEVIRLIASLYEVGDELYDSYEAYLTSRFSVVIKELRGVIEKDFFSADELASESFLVAANRFDDFFKQRFKPLLLSNVHSFSYAFGQKE